MGSTVNQVVKGYELIEVLGEGGFGAVYRAYQPLVKREVAIKVILPTFANHPEFVRRFETEAQIVAQLEHPYIVPLYDFWRDPSGAYLVMRLLRGGSLEDSLKQGAWEPEAAARLLDQIAGALSTAHQSSMIHGDIKPANILLDNSLNAYLTDFGLASNLQSDDESVTEVAGTPAYAAPEQIRRNQALGPYTDIYCLGLMMFEVLTGRRPFEEQTISGYVIAQLTKPTPKVSEFNPNLSPALDDVIQTATAKAPEERYQDVVAFARAFRQALQDKRGGNGHAPTIISLDDEIDDLISVEGTVSGFVLTADAIDLEALEVELVNPYKGLRAFQQGDAKDFFGREALTEQLVARMSDTEGTYRFLAVVGPSGSGKSSVVKAGLIPALRRGAVPGSDRYYIVEMMPSNDALRELENALLSIATQPPENITARLRQDPTALHQIVNEILPDDGSELLLLIDQFEEVFTLTDENATRVHFMESLRYAITAPDSRLRVVITIRADFYDKPLLYPEFGALVRERTEVVLPLTTAELERTIVGPAQRVGVRVEEELVSSIINDVKEEPGALPLLQYALTECFERRTGYVMTLESYTATGGVLGSLARRAEELYLQMDMEQQEAVRQLFLRLVTLGEGTEDTRRRILWSELVFTREVDDPLQHVLDMFGKYRLLTFDTDPLTREPTVEVAHEALIRQWKRLREWLQNSREDLRTQRRLNASVTDWRNANRDNSFLASGARLQQFESLLENSDLALTPDEIEYIQASVARREAALREEEERKARELALERQAARVFRALVVVFAVAAVIGIALALFAFQQRAVAEEQRVEAERERARAEREADVTLSLNLAQQAEDYSRGSSQPFDGLALAMEANRIQNPPAPAQSTLADLVWSPGAIRRLDEGSIVFRAAFTPDQKYLVSGNNLGILTLWDVATGEPVRQLGGDNHPLLDTLIFTSAVSPDGKTAVIGSLAKSFATFDLETGELIRHFDPNRREHTQPIWDADFTPDGSMLLVSSHDEQSGHNLILWDVATGEVVRRYEGINSHVFNVDFNADASQFVSADGDGSVVVWDFETGEIVQRFEAHTGWAMGVDFAPDGKHVISGGQDNQIIVWNIETGNALRRITGVEGTVRNLDISPNGDTFATAEQPNNIITVWDMATGERLSVFSSHTRQAIGVNYSPDGAVLASSAQDGILLWDVYGRGAELGRIDTAAPVMAAALSPDGTAALTGARDGAVSVWDVTTGEALRTLTPSAPLDAVQTVAYSPDGQTAATGSQDGSVVLWNVATGEELRRLEGYQAPVRSVAFSPDGTRVAAAGGNMQVSRDRVLDNSVVLWNAETGEELRRFEGHSAPVRDLAFSPDGTRLVSASEDITMILWDVETGEAVHTFAPDNTATAQIEGHTNGVLSVAFSPDGTQLLSGSRDKLVLLWNVESGQVVKPLVGHEANVNDVAFSADGTLALSAAGSLVGGIPTDNTVLLWDIAQGDYIRRFDNHTAPVHSVGFAADGESALSASDDGMLIRWRLDSLDELVNWIYDQYLVLCVDSSVGFAERMGENDRCQVVEDTAEIAASIPMQTAAPETDAAICTVPTPADFQIASATVDTSAFQREAPYTIGFISANAAEPRSAYIEAWARYEASQQDSIENFITRDGGGSDTAQIEAIDALIAEGVDLIILEPVETSVRDPLNEAVGRAQAANIPVVLVNHRLDTDAYVSFVGVDDYAVGCIMAQELAAAMDGEGHHVRINAIDSTISDDARKNGATYILSYPSITLADEFSTGLDPVAARASIQGMVNKTPVLTGIWAYNGWLSALAEDILAQNGRPLAAVVGDQDVRLAQIMQENNLNGALVRIPTTMGADAVQTALSILQGEDVSSWVQIPVEVIDSDALADYDLDAEVGLLGEAEGLPDEYRPTF